MDQQTQPQGEQAFVAPAGLEVPAQTAPGHVAHQPQNVPQIAEQAAPQPVVALAAEQPAKPQEAPRVSVPPVPAAPAEPAKVYVLDTTATAERPIRKHDMVIDGLIRPITFEFGKPTALDQHVAIKFLKHDGFKLTDKDGNLLKYEHRPKQPDELGAGEKFKLGENEVVARYDELTLASIFARACELPGGEQFAKQTKPDRGEMIAFIKATKKKMAEANKSKEADIGKDDFIPEADADGGFED